MEDCYYRRNYIPTFGNWEWNDDLPFTQCFESSRNAAYGGAAGFSEVRDLYVAGDLYENDVVTPAMIVVPRSRTKRHRHVKEAKKESWANDVKETPKPTPKPVDEDLYKISPELLCAKPKKKRGLSYIRSCFEPTCLV